MSGNLVCDVYRSPRKEETYLYVAKATGLVDVPARLLESFGEPEFVMTLGLKPETRLARVDRDEVVRLITAQGYFLQMPPGNDAFLKRHGHTENGSGPAPAKR